MKAVYCNEFYAVFVLNILYMYSAIVIIIMILKIMHKSFQYYIYNYAVYNNYLQYVQHTILISFNLYTLFLLWS